MKRATTKVRSLAPKQGLKTPQVAQLRKAPAAPPVYRPQPVPKVLQRKTTASPQPVLQSKQARVAPPVYRPQPVPMVLQLKSAQPSAGKTPGPRPSPNVPRVNRPLQQPERPKAGSVITGSNLQPKKSPATARPQKPFLVSLQSRPAGNTIQRMEEMQETGDLPIRRMRFKIAELYSSEVSETGFFRPARKRTTKEIVDVLFSEFLGIGVAYDLGTSGSALVTGEYPNARGPRQGETMRDAFGGNCIALSHAFADILKMADIKAEAVEVRPAVPGRAFIVHCPHFIDQQVVGHIYVLNAVWNFHYLFSNHTAVWVPALGVYYDPMAGTTYHNVSSAIVMELHAVDKSENQWRGWHQSKWWILTRQQTGTLGGFYRCDMVAEPTAIVPLGSVLTPLGVFKEAK